MDSVGTSILEDLDPYPPIAARILTTPSSAKSRIPARRGAACQADHCHEPDCVGHSDFSRRGRRGGKYPRGFNPLDGPVHVECGRNWEVACHT
ncbi:hypothetical protein ACFPRL_36310 [Pseudoclavibacter helvolus]